MKPETPTNPRPPRFGEGFFCALIAFVFGNSQAEYISLQEGCLALLAAILFFFVVPVFFFFLLIWCYPSVEKIESKVGGAVAGLMALALTTLVPFFIGVVVSHVVPLLQGGPK